MANSKGRASKTSNKGKIPRTSRINRSGKNASNGGFGKFFREARAEMKKVVWPTKKELINYTLVVFITVLIVSAVLGIVDTIFAKLFQLLMNAVT